MYLNLSSHQGESFPTVEWLYLFPKQNEQVLIFDKAKLTLHLNVFVYEHSCKIWNVKMSNIFNVSQQQQQKTKKYSRL